MGECVTFLGNFKKQFVVYNLSMSFSQVDDALTNLAHFHCPQFSAQYRSVVGLLLCELQ